MSHLILTFLHSKSLHDTKKIVSTDLSPFSSLKVHVEILKQQHLKMVWSLRDGVIRVVLRLQDLFMLVCTCAVTTYVLKVRVSGELTV